MSGRRSRDAAGDEEPDPSSGEPAAHGGEGESASDDCFAEAMRDVEPLADRDKVRRRGSSAITAPRRRAPARQISFEFPRSDEPLLGHVSGMQRRQLERLRSGQIRPESSIDLHRLQTEPARAALRHRLIDAHDAGQRCVVVIHGRGLRSQRGPVLKRALPAWLTDATLASRVLAFAPARPEDGGEGATYVLLRRSRE